MSQKSSKIQKSMAVVESLKFNAEGLKNLNKYEEASCAKLVVAKIDKNVQMQISRIVSLYEHAADFYLKTNDIRAYSCLMYVIRMLVENAQIGQAIEFCFRNGYRYLIECNDPQIAEDLYTTGEELRILHDHQHSCVFTEFVEAYFKDNVTKAIILKCNFIQNERNESENGYTHTCMSKD
ncbi:hypothetical protein RF11_06537 [Thelohanellus kitauei]|uniref:Uncharacterized protein n=1 Tax=Thelohanellus kitauei TaxID=669202 RepID=A0A0C2MQV1_THEKT|nr:hypothetical protein RF11_06537 [Thelohanellus kitauei]